MQYYLMVFASASLRARRTAGRKALLISMASATVIFAIIVSVALVARQSYGGPSLWDNVWVRIAVGLFAGVNLIHFWIDSFIWKMSDTHYREQHGEAFAF